MQIFDKFGNKKRTFDEVSRHSSLPILSLPAVRTLYCTTPQQCIAACRTILFLSREQFTVWGFDCEWKVEFKKEGLGRVALIQFASPRLIALLQITSCGIVPPLLEILANKCIFKLGVNISGDIAKLRRDYSLTELHGMIDLRTLSTAVGDRPSSSLAALATQYLRQELPKPPDTRMSDWEVVPLSESQRIYAALDAYCAYMIYDVIRTRRCEQLSKDTQDKYMLSLLNKVTITSKLLPAPPVEGAIEPLAHDESNNKYLLSDTSRTFLQTLPLHVASSSSQALGFSSSEISYQLFASGKSIQDVADTRSLKLDTVVTHILKTTNRGHGYAIHSFGITPPEVETIVAAYAYVQKVLCKTPLLRAVMDAHGVVAGAPTEYWKIRVVASHMEKVLGYEWISKFDVKQQKQPEDAASSLISPGEKQSCPPQSRVRIALSASSRKALQSLPQTVACSTPVPLGFSREETSYRMFVTGMSIDGIASERHRKPETIVNHIVATIHRGYGYDLRLFGIPTIEIERIIATHVYIRAQRKMALPENIADTYTALFETYINTWKLRVLAFHLMKVQGEDWIDKYQIEEVT